LENTTYKKEQLQYIQYPKKHLVFVRSHLENNYRCFVSAPKFSLFWMETRRPRRFILIHACSH